MAKKSPILESVLKTAQGLYRAGALDQITLREYEQLCLPPIEPLTPEEIKQIREKANMSQSVFAMVLNTSVSAVQKWEGGAKRPGGPALKLLRLAEKRGIEALV